jgi:uncharacterized membrane protein YjjB (DUF3815 family)
MMPVAVLAFAGAVTMIPGLSLYRALGGALRLARLDDLADPGLVAATLGQALHAGLVISGLALGLILGVRAVPALTEKRDAPTAAHARPDLGEAAHQVTAERLTIEDVSRQL